MTDQTAGNVPRIRFKGFDAAWEPKKLGQIYTERNERGNESLPILSVSIHSGISNGELSSETLGKKVRRSEDKSLYKHVHAGDLVLNMMRAWQGALGVAQIEGMVSPAYLTATPDDTIYPLFMDSGLRRPQIVAKMNNLSYGVTDFRKRLYWDSFVFVEVDVPCVREQKKISGFLSNLDAVISLHQRKHDKLLTLKEAMLQKMLPRPGATRPEIRFKGFSGEWAERALGQIFSYQRPDNYIVGSSAYSSSNRVPVLTANKAFVLGYTSETRTFDQPCVIFDDFTLDAKFVNFPFMVKSSAIKILTIRDSSVDDLYFSYLALSNAQIEAMGHARHYIGFVQPTLIRTPAIAEQQRIGMYFRALDSLISKHSIQLQKLQNLKSACMERMFI